MHSSGKVKIGHRPIWLKLSELREAIGKYERNEVVPSVEVAKKIVGIFEVTLDYLVNDKTKPFFDKQTVQRLMGY